MVWTRDGRKKQYSTQEFARMQGVSDARNRQLILEDRLWPRPQKVGGGWAIVEGTEVLRPPERNRTFDKIKRQIDTQEDIKSSDVQHLVRVARHWIQKAPGN